MNTEVLRITTLLEEGKITAEQAAALISALKSEPTTTTNSETAKSTSEMSAKRSQLEQDMAMDQIPNQKMLQVRVLSGDGDRVKINLPLNFVKGILKVSGKLPMVKAEHMEGVDMEALMESINMAIDQDLGGRIVDIETATGDIVIVDIVNGHA